MVSEVESKLDAIKDICRRNQVEVLYLFGSAARGDFRSDSDVDFAVRFKASPERGLNLYFRTCDELEDLFDRKVDLVEFEGQRKRLIAEIERDRELIYAA